MLRRFRAWLRRDAVADEIRDEMAFHLEMRIEERMRQGLSRAEAERLARRRFGNVARLIDEGYDVRGGGVVETVVQDVRYCLRQLRRRPAYASAVIATLALGMSLVATLSSIVDASWIRPLPYASADRIGDITFEAEVVDGHTAALNPSAQDVAALQGLTSVFAAVGTYHAFEERPIVDTGEPERVRALTASEGYFEVLGATPQLGRTFVAADGKRGAEAVVILGFAYWRQRFAGAADIVGQRVTIDGVRSTIIGVAPPEFHRAVHVWRPMLSYDDRAELRGSGATVLVRLREGVTWEDARVALEASARQLPPARHSGRVATVTLKPVYREMINRTRDAVLLVAAAVFVLVVLVGVNVSGLVFADGVARRHELAIRASLGAGRGRLVRQQLTDATLLALASSVVGLSVAAVALDALLAVLPLELPPHGAPAINLRTMAATLLCGVLVAWVVTAWPAWRLAGLNLREWLEGRAPDVRIRGFSRPGQVSVFLQVMLAVVLLAGGGLLLRSLDRLLSVDLGFEPDAVHVLDVAPLDSSPVVWAQYYPALVERLRALPGVESVGATDWIPLRPVMAVLAVAPEGGPELDPAGVTPGVLEAMGVRVIGGRLFTASDEGHPVAVLSEAAAREVFGDTDVVGRPVDLGGPHTVIGVVSDIRGWGPDSDPQKVAYTWLHPHSFMPPSIVMRLTGVGLSMAEVRAAAASVGPRVIVERMRSATALLTESTEKPRERSALLSLLALCGLVLALVGVAGVTAQAVARRTREIGVRMACGAAPQQVVRAIAADTLRPALLGVAVGFGVSFLMGGVIERYLFQVTLADPVTMVTVGLGVVISAAVVAWIPARHAARVDPALALRQ